MSDSAPDQLLFIGATEQNRRHAKKHLSEIGTVEFADTFRAGIAQLTAKDFSVVVIDLVTAAPDLAEFLMEVRRVNPAARVLVITLASMVAERVSAVEHEAGDDMIRPFATVELVARIRVLAKNRTKESTASILAGDVELDRLRGTVKRGGRSIFLTARELRLLETFLRRQGATVTRSELELAVYGGQHELRSNAIESVISALRKKLCAAGEANLILTRRGFGYMWNA